MSSRQHQSRMYFRHKSETTFWWPNMRSLSYYHTKLPARSCFTSCTKPIAFQRVLLCASKQGFPLWLSTSSGHCRTNPGRESAHAAVLFLLIRPRHMPTPGLEFRSRAKPWMIREAVNTQLLPPRSGRGHPAAGACYIGVAAQRWSRFVVLPQKLPGELNLALEIEGWQETP